MPKPTIAEPIRLHFLYAATKGALTKKITKQGTIPYPNEYLFSSKIELVSTITEFAAAIEKHGSRGAALLKGELPHELDKESRRGLTSNDESTRWVVLDFDKVEGIEDVEEILGEIECLDGVSYVIQYGSSHGLGGKFSAHVFMLLAQPISSALLEGWLSYLNMSEEVLKKHLRLSGSGLHVAWPLDPVPARNTQIIYIARPTFEGVPDPMKGKSRIKVVEKKTKTLDPSDMPPLPKVKQMRRALLKTLRRGAKLVEPTFRKTDDGFDVISGVRAAVTEIVDSNEEFVRVNIANGDSAAYWFWRKDPRWLFSFKSEEEVYSLPDLDPGFYSKYVKSPEFLGTASGEMQMIAHADASRSDYLIGHFDPRENVFLFNEEEVAKPVSVNSDKLKAFLRAQGYNPRSYITPLATLRYDPTNIGLRFDAKTGVLNTFVPSRFMYAEPGAKQLPPETAKLIRSVLGAQANMDQFIKWIAYVLQSRSQAGTAWLFQGAQGSGKNVLVNHVLVPMFGQSNCAIITAMDLADKFTDYLDSKLLLFIDEADLTKLGPTGMVHTRMKNIVSNKRVAIRKMHRAVSEIESHVNVILATNMQNAMFIPADDRRYNVTDYGPQSLIEQGIDPQKLLRSLDKELDALASYLMGLRVTQEDVSRPLDNDARRALQEFGSSSVDQITRKLQEGDLEHFISLIPHGDTPLPFDVVNAYESTLRRWLWELPNVVSREELMSIYRFNAPKLVRDHGGPVSEGRFLSSQNFRSRVALNTQLGLVQRQFYLRWTTSEERLSELRKLLPRGSGKPELRAVKGAST